MISHGHTEKRSTHWNSFVTIVARRIILIQRVLTLGFILSAAMMEPKAMADDRLTPRDVHALFDLAEAAGRVGITRKSKPVDVRPAKPGEVVVTIIAGEGEETRSRPAEAGDRVVRNPCPATGNEEYLVKAAKFAERYDGPFGDAEESGWSIFRPRGKEMRYFILSAEDGAFTFTAPWGEPMIARPGDAIVRDPNDRADTYRVAGASFDCTYEVVVKPG
jgi:hypothetical protein